MTAALDSAPPQDVSGGHVLAHSPCWPFWGRSKIYAKKRKINVDGLRRNAYCVNRSRGHEAKRPRPRSERKTQNDNRNSHTQIHGRLSARWPWDNSQQILRRAQCGGKSSPRCQAGRRSARHRDRGLGIQGGWQPLGHRITDRGRGSSPLQSLSHESHNRPLGQQLRSPRHPRGWRGSHGLRTRHQSHPRKAVHVHAKSSGCLQRLSPHGGGMGARQDAGRCRAQRHGEPATTTALIYLANAERSHT